MEFGDGGVDPHREQTTGCFLTTWHAVTDRLAADSRGGRTERWEEFCTGELCWEVSQRKKGGGEGKGGWGLVIVGVAPYR